MRPLRRAPFVRRELNELEARHLAGYAQRKRLPAHIRLDDRFGWTVLVTTPFHDRPQIVVDRMDIDYLLVEIKTGPSITEERAA